MSSNINPNNIDATYPVAGQDNDSQGFRDNFTNIKTNFQFAEDEITDLQNKVLLKAALDGTALDNDMSGALLKNAKLQGARYTRIAPTSTIGTIDVDFAAGSYYKISQLSGDISLDFNNIPSAGNYAEWTVQITQPTVPYTVTLPAEVSIGNTTLQGCNTNNVITYAQGGNYSLKFWTTDGGATIGVEDLSQNSTGLTYQTTVETITGNVNLSLATTTSIINKSGDYSGNLANGFAGQTKIVICKNSAAGTQTLNLASAGWNETGPGTLTFNEQGQSATLMFIGGTWYCISTGPGTTNTYPAVD